jgi:hypothetical protein
MQLPVSQKRTFLPYLRGVACEALRLGSLYINPLEPDDGLASKRFEFRTEYVKLFPRSDPSISREVLTCCSIEDQNEYEKLVRKRTREQKDHPFSIEFETSQAKSLGVSFSDVLTVAGERNKATLVRIQGESGRRLKIKE